MHRTYSMRQTRAPTASQIQVRTPWPPVRLDDANADRASAEPAAPAVLDQVRPPLWARRLRWVPQSAHALATADTRCPGHALRRNAAGAFRPDLAKKLSQLVKMEKNVMRSLEMVAKERMEVAVGSAPSPPHARPRHAMC